MPEIPTDAEQTSLETTVPPSRRALTMAWTRSHLHLVAPVVVYLMLVIFGITTSNIGVNYMREDPAKPLGVQIMSASEIRSDEYTTQSPLWLGEMAVGGMETQNPLSASPDFFAQLPDGPVSAVVFFEGSLLTLQSRWIQPGSAVGRSVCWKSSRTPPLAGSTRTNPLPE